MLTFKQLTQLLEQSGQVEFQYGKHDYDPKSAVSTSNSGPHSITVEYTHKYLKDDDTKAPEGHYAVDFKTDSSYTGTGSQIPPEHKGALIHHLNQSLNSFIKMNKPKLLRLGVTSEDPAALQKLHQYHKFAKLLAARHNGTVETNEHDNEARVRFDKNINENIESKDGESVIAYHATHIPFNKFRPFSHFGTHDASLSRAAQIAEQNKNVNVFDSYKAKLNLGKTVDIPDPIEHSPAKIAKLLHDHGHIDRNDYRKIRNAMTPYNEDDHKNRYKALAAHLNNIGIHTISYTNQVEDPGSKSYMITDPKRVEIIKKTEGVKLDTERGKRKTLKL